MLDGSSMKLSKLQCGDFKVCTTDTTKDELSVDAIASFKSWKLYNTNFSLVIQEKVAYIFIHIIYEEGLLGGESKN